MANGLQSAFQTALTVRNLLEDTRDKQRQLAQQKEERDYLNYQRHLQRDQAIATDIMNYFSDIKNVNAWVDNYLKENPGKTSQEAVDAFDLYRGQYEDMLNRNMGQYGFSPKSLKIDYSAAALEDFQEVMKNAYEDGFNGIPGEIRYEGFQKKWKHFMPTINTVIGRQQTENNIQENAMQAQAAAAAAAQGQGQGGPVSGQVQAGGGGLAVSTPIDTPRDTLDTIDTATGSTAPGEKPVDLKKLQGDIKRLETAVKNAKNPEDKARFEQKLNALKEQQQGVADKINAVDRGINESQQTTPAATAPATPPVPALTNPDYNQQAVDSINSLTAETAAVAAPDVQNSLFSMFQAQWRRGEAARLANEDQQIIAKRMGGGTLGDAIKAKAVKRGYQFFDDLRNLPEAEQAQQKENVLFDIMGELKREGLLTRSDLAQWQKVINELSVQDPEKRVETQAFIQEYMPYIAMDDTTYFKGDNSERQWTTINNKERNDMFKALNSLKTDSIDNPAVINNWINAVTKLYGVDDEDIITDFMVVLASRAASDTIDKEQKRREMEAKIKGMEINNKYADQLKAGAVKKLDTDIRLIEAKIWDVVNGNNSQSSGAGGTATAANSIGSFVFNGQTVPIPGYAKTNGAIGATFKNMAQLENDPKGAEYIPYIETMATLIAQNPGLTPQEYMNAAKQKELFKKTKMSADGLKKVYNNTISILLSEGASN